MMTTTTMVTMMIAYNWNFLGNFEENGITLEVGATDEPVCKYASCIVSCKFH